MVEHHICNVGVIGSNPIRSINMSENNFEKIEENPIQDAIEKAQSEAIPFDQLEKIKNEIDDITANFLQKKITLSQYNELCNNLESYPGFIKIGSAQMFEEYLRACSLNEKTIAEFVQHEGEHFKAIENAGLKAEYRIEFSKKADGEFSMYPQVSFDFPQNMKDGEARNLLKNIISAASELSDRDRNQLG